MNSRQRNVLMSLCLAHAYAFQMSVGEEETFDSIANFVDQLIEENIEIATLSQMKEYV